MHELLQAPWSNQKVAPFVRVLAWVFIACAAFAFGLLVYFSLREGLPARVSLQAIAILFLSAYLTAVFLFVAVKGRAPSGWLPWK